MKTNFILSIMLGSIILSCIFGLFYDDAFAQNPSLNNDDSKVEERKKELEQKKIELAINRENLEAKQLKKSQKFEEKLKEIKEKSQNKLKAKITNDEFSLKSKQVEEKLIKKSEEIQQRLVEKSDKLDSRTKNILDEISDGQYMGPKIPSKDYLETYELIFDSVDASQISDQSQMSTMTGKMTFSLYDKSKSDLKLELNECEIIVDEINYNCGFGKARTVSSGQSGAKDSLVIMAFLEDGVLEELHATMKLFVNADIPINNIEQSQVSIISPQSKISNLWFLNGNATLTKTTSEDILFGNDITTSLEEGMPFGDK